MRSLRLGSGVKAEGGDAGRMVYVLVSLVPRPKGCVVM